ncbi:MAG: BNR-4 repeat-containing protein, partial [bacterium]|nr:BNR-4 repeat-containing protein [bacterium]
QHREMFVLEKDWDVDDHNTLSILTLPDGRLMVFYARHNKVGLFCRTTDAPLDITRWRDEITVSDTDRITYSHPAYLADEGLYFVVWRGPTWKPTFATSSDGITWSESHILVQEAGREASNIRPYLKAVSDNKSSVHFAFNDGHPRNETTNSVYYIKYEKGKFYRADGTQIGDMANLPIAHSKSDVVYDAKKTDVRAWIWDIALDKKGSPILVYTTLPEITDHRYHYAVYTAEGWQSNPISPAGPWFPQTPAGEKEPETEYSGGICLNHADPSVVYLSRPVDGIFEIERWQTRDGGQSWASQSVTRASDRLNVRPVVPRGYPSDKIGVLWMHGTYVHYTNYHTEIRMVLEP